MSPRSSPPASSAYVLSPGREAPWSSTEALVEVARSGVWQAVSSPRRASRLVRMGPSGVLVETRTRHTELASATPQPWTHPLGWCRQVGALRPRLSRAVAHSTRPQPGVTEHWPPFVRPNVARSERWTGLATPWVVMLRRPESSTGLTQWRHQHCNKNSNKHTHNTCWLCLSVGQRAEYEMNLVQLGSRAGLAPARQQMHGRD